MTTRHSRHREVMKKIYNSLSDEKKLNHLMLDKLYRSILRGNKVQAGIISKAIEIIFPKAGVSIADTKFKAFWKLKHYRQAIKIYLKAGRIFGLADEVGRYYERRGQLKEAMEEFEYLINGYFKIRKDFMPFPNGPPELYKLGRWYADKDKARARKYLKLYLSAEDECRRDPSCYLWHKNAAKELLDRLKGSGGVNVRTN